MSTEPKTARGNNLHHGCRTAAVLLPGENPAQFQALEAELAANYGPEDQADDRYVSEMAAAEWSLRRVRSMMYAELAQQIDRLRPTHPELTEVQLQARAVATMSETGCSWDTWLRYENRAENQFDKAKRNWIRYQDLKYKSEVRELDLSYKNLRQQVERNTQLSKSTPVPAPTTSSNVQNLTHQQLTDPPKAPQISRRAPCPCGSRKKYKHCCGKSEPHPLKMAA